MGRIMQSWADYQDLTQAINFAGLEKTRDANHCEAGIAFAEALEKGLVEVEPVEHFDGLPHVKISNNSSWKILIFCGNELIGKMRDRMVNISVTLQHNASAVLPAFFPASTYFFDQGMISIQEYLHYFKVTDNQTGVVFRINGKISGERYGDFPLRVEVCYNH